MAVKVVHLKSVVLMENHKPAFIAPADRFLRYPVGRKIEVELRKFHLFPYKDALYIRNSK